METDLGIYLNRIAYFRGPNHFIGAMKIKVEGYFDASGKQENADLVVSVAGLLATPHQWNKFSKAWIKILDDAGVPKANEVPVFHTTDFMARKGFYGDKSSWTQEKRDSFYRKLIETIQGNILYPVGMSLYLDDYNKLLTEYPGGLKIFGSAGNFVSVLCFWHCAQWANKMKYHDTISYVFDRGDKFRTEIHKGYEIMCKSAASRAFWHFKVGGLTFENKEQFTPIQAADLVAWEFSKALKKANRAVVDKRYIRPSFNAFNHSGSDFKVYSYEDLISFLSDFVEKIEESENQVSDEKEN